MNKWDWNSMQLWVESYVGSVWLLFFFILFFIVMWHSHMPSISPQTGNIIMLQFECDFVYWKAGVFPMTRHEWVVKWKEISWTQMSCGLQKITIFIQISVWRSKNQMWLHFVIEYTNYSKWYGGVELLLLDEYRVSKH